MKYATAIDFRRALTERARGADSHRWLKLVCFERLLARLFDDPQTRWVLKGGYALELRLKGRARTTADLDLSVPPPPHSNLLELVQQAAERDLGDFFTYNISQQKSLQNAPEGGDRFLVEAFLGSKSFAKFHLDIGQGDVHSQPVDDLPAQTDLSFAGLPALTFPSYPLRDHFAEKLHAYTKPRERKTRVKDLLDLALLLELNIPQDADLAKAIRGVFERYDTHPIPQPLPLPPEDWLEPFRAMALEVGLQPEEALTWYARLEEFVRLTLA
jgi:predicted nucleotidyltransferase component of viral defense system